MREVSFRPKQRFSDLNDYRCILSANSFSLASQKKLATDDDTSL